MAVTAGVQGAFDTLATCLTEAHDLRIVALAAVICAIGMHSAYAIGGVVARSPRGRDQLLWGAAGTLATASAIWATHFIAMLAYRPGVPVAFALDATVGSFFLAVALVGLGSLIAIGRPGPGGRTLGGIVSGLAISAMHYTGMAGYDVPGTLHWEPSWVTASVISGVFFTVASGHAAWSRHRLVRRSAGTLLMLGVCAAHFLGMAAVTVTPDPFRQIRPGALSSETLLVLVTNAALLVLALALVAVFVSVRFERRRRAEERRLRDFADVAVEGLLICDGDRIVGLNRSLEQMLGRSRDSVLGRSLAEILPGIAAAADVPVGRERDATVTDADGTSIPVRIVAQDIALGDSAHRVVAIRDQRERLSAEAEIRRLAHLDPLTGLPNRRSFGEALATRLGPGARLVGRVALVMLDLDRFKPINDTLGHAMGDQLLRRVAGRLSAALREGDLLARLGGDEFAVLASVADAAEAEALADRLIEIARRPYVIDGHVLEIGASAGIALAPADGRTPDALAQSADIALYAAKEAGRGTWRLFETEMTMRRQQRRDLELDLRRAVARRELQVHYQPQVDAATGAFTGAEALVRWHHAERGTVPPSVFVPLAEEIGLIGEIGTFVLRRACEDAAQWPGTLTVAVNLSPLQLKEPGLVETVLAILGETGLAPSRLELEITETALLHDDGSTIATLAALRARGIQISMDDFGTGYSSLSHLSRFPFDKIKIDRSFIQLAPHHANSASIVRAITTLGRRLGMAVTAEGVETEAQRAFMLGEGASQLQGYLISRPVPADAVAELFRAHSRVETG